MSSDNSKAALGVDFHAVRDIEDTMQKVCVWTGEMCLCVWPTLNLHQPSPQPHHTSRLYKRSMTLSLFPLCTHGTPLHNTIHPLVLFSSSSTKPLTHIVHSFRRDDAGISDKRTGCFTRTPHPVLLPTCRPPTASPHSTSHNQALTWCLTATCGAPVLL